MEITNIQNPRNTTPNPRLVDVDVTTKELGTFEYTVDLDAPAIEEHEILIRDTVLANLSEVTPYTATTPTLEEVYASQYNMIENSRDTALADPYGTVVAHEFTWQVDPTSIKQLTEALATFNAIGETPEGLVWRDAENVNHPASLSFLAGIAAARAVQVQAIWQKSWDLKADLDAAYDSEDREAMEALTW